MAGQVTTKSIVIGLDFGTTYSGAAWAIAEEQPHIEVVSTWPGGGNRKFYRYHWGYSDTRANKIPGTSVKVPTVVTFSENRFLWGWQALASPQEPIRGVKLLLDEDQSHRYSPSLRAKKMLDFLKKSSVDISAEYLKKVIEHVHQNLERRFGPVVNEMSRKYILTVPAVWSDKAKDATMKIAIKAGINEHQLSLLSEPEAAALYTLRVIQPNTIKKGDAFVVCDAGGGTVDLISYRVHDLAPLKLNEVVEGTGGVCGSMVLDDRFERFLEELLGFQTFELLPERTRNAALRYWQDSIKPYYAGTDLEDNQEDIGWELPLPGLPDQPLIELEGGFLQLSKSQVQGIFDPVVQDVINLVQQQVRKIKLAGISIRAILLVGGFGGCEYLFRRLCKANPKITIMQPPDAWQAVVCGAVLRGLEGNQVKNRLARSHYGVTCRMIFNPDIHNDAEAYWCHFEEEWMVNHLMSWIISKEALISENDPVRKSFYRCVACDDEKSLVFKNTLYFSGSDIAPDRMSNNVNKLCDLRVDLRAVPKQLFKKRTNSTDISYYKIKYDLAIIPTSGYMYFQLEFNGTAYGTVQAEYY